MKKHYNYNNVTKNENRIIGLIQSKSNKLNQSQILKKKQQRLNNLTQNEINIIKKYKKMN
tara:strand:- start:314 stop:493 length:180 start_codon:yes stop_codon:yes gene_type:complete